MFSFIIVRFSLTNILVLGLKLRHLSSFFLFNNGFLKIFSIYKLDNRFLELTLSGWSIRCQSSISEDSASTSISPNTDITVLSNSSSAMVSGMSLRTKLFLLPYCSRALVEVSSETSLFSNFLHLVLSYSLSSWNYYGIWRSV